MSANGIVTHNCDGLSNSAQESFRGFIEEYSQNARFILSANYQNKIIEPILNRLIIFDFDELFAKNVKELAKQCFDRLCFILDNENITYEKEDVKPIVMSLYPSVRKMINTLQQSIVDGVLIIDNTMLEANSIYDEIMMNVKSQQFDKCRGLIGKVHNPHAFYNYVYKNVDRLFKQDSIPTVIMTTYHFLSSNVNARDPEISLAAYCAQIMRNVEIKFL
jgi:replication factor C small subunit